MMMKEGIDLSEIHVKNAIKIMMEDSDYSTFKAIAEQLDMQPTTLRSAMNNNALRLKELMAISELLGYTITLQKK